MLETIKKDLAPYYTELNQHPIYSKLTTLPTITQFMELHIYSVWDFMNLLKYLQNKLTCTTLPWQPYHTPKLSRLINEIVLEEESDIIDNQVTSHFQYYYNALKQIKQTNHITKFYLDLPKLNYSQLISQNYIPVVAKQFMQTTYNFTKQSDLAVAAAFTFGRETLVPTLFDPIKDQLNQSKNTALSTFIAYLERHIELDGEQHSKLAFEMVEILAQSESDWLEIKASAITALQARKQFWDGIAQQLI